MDRWRILHKTSNFTIIDNGIFEDKDLSLDEVGFLCKILYLPEGWHFNIEGIASSLKEGRDYVYSIINRLIEHGYCKRTQERASKTGRFKSYDYTFYEVKNGLGCASAPLTASPDTASPDTESPYTAKPTLISTKENKVLRESSTEERGRNARPKFTPPTQSEVREYFHDKGLTSDPMAFWLHFENSDWKLSKGKGARMTDWRLAALSWEKRERQFTR